MNRQPSRTIPSILAALTLFTMPASAAQDHLVALDVAQSRLQESAERRQADLAHVDRALATPLARAAAASLGRDADVLRAAVYTLDDKELHDLALRAAILQIDPVAGMRTGLKVTFIVVGTFLSMILVLYLGGVSA